MEGTNVIENLIIDGVPGAGGVLWRARIDWVRDVSARRTLNPVWLANQSEGFESDLLEVLLDEVDEMAQEVARSTDARAVTTLAKQLSALGNDAAMALDMVLSGVSLRRARTVLSDLRRADERP